jgi:hypothetical protein
MAASARAADLTTLLSYLPESHAYSLELVKQLSSLTSSELESSVDGLPDGVTIQHAQQVAAGLIEVEISVQSQISADGECINYGFFSWTVCIGGRGLGSDTIVGMDDSRSILSAETAAPVAVRFTVPMAHILVDDMGFLDNSVWSMLPPVPSLLQIVNMVGSVLLGPQSIQDSDPAESDVYRERWAAAQRHAYNKHLLAQSFLQISQHKEFLHPAGVYHNISCAGWLQPAFVSMTASLKAALFEAAGIPHSEDTKFTALTAQLSHRHAQTAPVIAAWRSHVQAMHPGIFAFDMFTKSFCASFIEEVALYESSALPRRRPNTMNNYGLILNDIGMYGLMSALMEAYLVPLVQVLFAEEPVAYGLDHHHSFIVQYQRSAVVAANSTATDVHGVKPPTVELPAGDKGLDMHHDSSEVTVNVCLGKEGFQGGGLRFCGLAGTGGYRKLQYTLQHVLGRAVVHLGRHRHGADDLLPPVATSDPMAAAVAPACPPATTDALSLPPTTTGAPPTLPSVPKVLTSERLNLIMWLRSSQFRAAAAYGLIAPDGFPKIPEPEGFAPDVCCLSKFNDADYVKQLEKAKAAAHL